MADHQTSKLECWQCHTGLDGHMNADSSDTMAPEDGNASLCIYCGAWAFFAKDGDGLILRPPTNEEWFNLTTKTGHLATMVGFMQFRARTGIGVPE